MRRERNLILDDADAVIMTAAEAKAEALDMPKLRPVCAHWNYADECCGGAA